MPIATQANSRFVGMDIHKHVVVRILDDRGRVLLWHRCGCSRTDLEQFAHRYLQATDQVVLEATTNTWQVVAVLKPFVAEVVVSNPLKTKAIAEAKIKTDKVDALVLAQLLRCDFLPCVWEPPVETQQLRRQTARRAALVADATAIKNRIYAVLHQRLHRIRSLPQVCDRVALPRPLVVDQLPVGEVRIFEQNGTLPFVQEIHQEHT